MSDRNWDFVEDGKALAMELDAEIERIKSENNLLYAKIEALIEAGDHLADECHLASLHREWRLAKNMPIE